MLKRHLSALVVALLCLGLPMAAAPASGASRPWVEKAQQRLNGLGCNAGPADGHLSERTRSAVVRFQSRHHLAQSGRFTDITRTRLYAEDARRCDTRPVPGHTGHGRRVVISQHQNWVWLVGRDGHTVAQSGMIDNPSVLRAGADRVGSYCGRAARIKRNTDGHGLLLDQFVRFAPCGVGFHRIPRYQSNGRQIHADWLVGTDLRKSHGCIRLPESFSRRVWRFATVGTEVRVTRD